ISGDGAVVDEQRATAEEVKCTAFRGRDVSGNGAIAHAQECARRHVYRTAQGPLITAERGVVDVCERGTERDIKSAAVRRRDIVCKVATVDRDGAAGHEHA